ncbi:MAG: hypothetical protein GWN85_09935, partial [Gemmatimonadetes bacterium]|nr:hypothetical protein [Gemmatimonadota bacterium]NIR36066.1 hypothetical protein [Actinomycetota bacterium]NIW27374.1 hypothetical protein [Actinomycetota bacterium]
HEDALAEPTPLSRFRGAAMRRSVMVTWVVVVVVVAQSIRREVAIGDGLFLALGVFLAGLAGASVLDWQAMMSRELGSW